MQGRRVAGLTAATMSPVLPRCCRLSGHLLRPAGQTSTQRSGWTGQRPSGVAATSSGGRCSPMFTVMVLAETWRGSLLSCRWGVFTSPAESCGQVLPGTGSWVACPDKPPWAGAHKHTDCRVGGHAGDGVQARGGELLARNRHRWDQSSKTARRHRPEVVSLLKGRPQARPAGGSARGQG
jgi:hypothetical protein